MLAEGLNGFLGHSALIVGFASAMLGGLVVVVAVHTRNVRLVRVVMPYGWLVQWIVQMRHRAVRTVNCQRVLDQVIGPERYKIQSPQERSKHQCGCRNFNHATDFNVFIKTVTAAAKLCFRLLNHCQGLFDFVGVCHHRH